MVFCYQNCFDLLWEKIVLVTENIFWNSRLKADNLQKFVTTRTICSNSERSEQLQNAFLTCSWRFLRYDKLEQLLFTLEKIIGISKHAGKVRKYFSGVLTPHHARRFLHLFIGKFWPVFNIPPFHRRWRIIFIWITPTLGTWVQTKAMAISNKYLNGVWMIKRIFQNSHFFVWLNW